MDLEDQQRVRAIQPNTTMSASTDGRWLDEYVAYTSWAMYVLAHRQPVRRTADGCHPADSHMPPSR